jgi:FkbM family methyltransferase
MATPIDIVPGSRYNMLQDSPHYPKICVFDMADGISKEVMLGVDWEPEVCKTLAENYVPGTDVIDVGANLGLNALGMHRRSKITGTIHMFEPQHDVFTALRYNASHLPARLYNFACADMVRMLRFEQCYGNIGGTPLQGEGGAIASPFALPINTKTTHVLAFPLDALQFVNRVSVIKIDAEGAEKSVLTGAMQTLATHRPAIVVEVWKQNRGDVFELLQNLGYRMAQHIHDTFDDDFLFLPTNPIEK